MTGTVRAASAADAALLHELAAATFALACPPGTMPANIEDFIGRNLSEARFTEYLAQDTRELLIAESEGVPVGYTMLVFEEPVDADVAAALTVRPSAELSKCYLLPNQHGRGLAAMLMAASVGVARARGVAGVWLGVNQHNARANRFYQKSGFRIAGAKKFLVGGKWEDDFVRELVLSEWGAPPQRGRELPASALISRAKRAEVGNSAAEHAVMTPRR